MDLREGFKGFPGGDHTAKRDTARKLRFDYNKEGGSQRTKSYVGELVIFLSCYYPKAWERT